MGRLRCVKTRKGTWNEEEDLLLKNWVEKYGEGKWRHIPFRTGLNRCRKSCRLRWLNYLRPNIKHGDFAPDEADLIIRLHRLLGNRWSLIAGRIPGRTGNDIKNYWNSHLSKKLTSEQKITSSLMSHPMDPPLLTTNSAQPWEVSVSSCGNQRPEEGESREGDEEEDTLSFWKSLLLQGLDVENIKTVNTHEMKVEDEDFFVGFEDLLQDMEKWGLLKE